MKKQLIFVCAALITFNLNSADSASSLSTISDDERSSESSRETCDRLCENLCRNLCEKIESKRWKELPSIVAQLAQTFKPKVAHQLIAEIMQFCPKETAEELHKIATELAIS